MQDTKLPDVVLPAHRIKHAVQLWLSKQANCTTGMLDTRTNAWQCMVFKAAMLQQPGISVATLLQRQPNLSSMLTQPLSQTSACRVHFHGQCSALASRSCTTASTGQAEKQGTDITRLTPLLQSQWDHLKNAHFGNVLITPHGHKKVWWVCDQCPDGHAHEWEATVANRTNGSSCPYCASRRVCQHSSLPTIAPAVAAQWSSNNQLSSDRFTANSNKPAIWQCCCGHEWTATISNRTHGKTGCPECQRVKKTGRTPQRHPVLAQGQPKVMQLWDWEANGRTGLDPSELRCFSAKQASWICHKCPKGQPHRWQARVRDVSWGSRCPCCAGKQACSCNSLQALHPTIAAEWDYTRNQGTPRDYLACSHKEIWWYNRRRGHFQSRIVDRTYVRGNTMPKDRLSSAVSRKCCTVYIAADLQCCLLLAWLVAACMNGFVLHTCNFVVRLNTHTYASLSQQLLLQVNHAGVKEVMPFSDRTLSTSCLSQGCFSRSNAHFKQHIKSNHAHHACCL